MTLKPDDRLLMAENRYPITDIGMEKMLDSVLAIWDREKQIDPANLEVKFISSAMVGLAEVRRDQSDTGATSGRAEIPCHPSFV